MYEEKDEEINEDVNESPLTVDSEIQFAPKDVVSRGSCTQNTCRDVYNRPMDTWESSTLKHRVRTPSEDQIQF